jgi:hypothetical protein
VRAPRCVPALAAALGVLAVVYAVSVVSRTLGGEVLHKGDARALVDATRSVADDRDLDMRGQASLHLYEGSTPGVSLSESESVVALGRHGEMYPKHPWLLAVMGAPFYRLWQENGMLALNGIFLLALAAAMFALAHAAGAAPRICAVAAVLLGASPVLTAFSYGISIDVPGTAFAALGLAALCWRFPTLAGLLFGLAILARVTHGCLLFGALFLLSDWRAAVRFACGLLPPIGALMAMNWHMFGGAFEMSYNHVLVLVQGEHATASHGDLFDRSLVSGLLDQLCEWPHGLLFSAPVAVLGWLGIPWLVRRAPALALSLVVAATSLYVLFASYVYANDSPFGLRFLLPLIGLAAAPLAVLLERLVSRPVVVPEEPAADGSESHFAATVS